MKVAVSSTGEGLDSPVDFRFGRCAFFVIAEIADGKIKDSKNLRNEATSQFGGAGMTAAQLVANQKVKAVITGNVGPRAFGVLQQLDIDIYQATGSVREAVQALADGKLQKISEPTGPMFMGGEGAGAGTGTGAGTGQGPGRGMGTGAGRGAGQGRSGRGQRPS